MSIALDDYKEQQMNYVELLKQEATLRILDATVEDSTDGNSFVLKLEMEGAPGKLKAKDGTEIDATSLKISPWWYLPKSGKTQAGKPHPRWTTVATLARKLGISTAGVSSDILPAEFVSQFVGRAFIAGDFVGEREVKKVGGEPVMQEDGVTPKTFINYNFWQVKDAAPKFDVK